MMDGVITMKQCYPMSNIEDLPVFGKYSGDWADADGLKAFEGKPCPTCENPVEAIRYMVGNTTHWGRIYDGIYCAHCNRYYRKYRVELCPRSLAELEVYTALLCEYCNVPVSVGSYSEENDYGYTEQYVGLICFKCNRITPSYRYAIDLDDLPYGDWDKLNEHRAKTEGMR